MAQVFLFSFTLYLTCYLLQSSAATAAADSKEIRLMLFLCDGTGSLLSHIRVKLAFDIAIETVDERIKWDDLQTFYLNGTFHQGCLYNTIGVGSEYYSLAYDALFGPPFSPSTNGELLLTKSVFSVKLRCQNHEMFYTSSLLQ